MDSQLTSITFNGVSYWSLHAISPIADGTYTVEAQMVDAAGSICTATNQLTVDTVPPASPTVNALVTNNSQPVITGRWDQSTPGGATVLQVTVAGTTYTLGTNSQLTSDGLGHWTLTLTTPLADGTYPVGVSTADAAGNGSTSTSASSNISGVPTANQLTVDTMPPATPTVNSLITNNNEPVLTGTWDQGTSGGATVLQVTVAGTTYTLGTNPQLTSDGSGHWTLAMTAPLADGTYTVGVYTADAAGNVSTSTTVNQLTVDTVPPVTPTINTLATSNPTPILSGTWDSVSATLLQVTVNGTTYTLGSSSQLTTTGSNWTLNLAGTTALLNGAYDIKVHTADAAGNTSDDKTANELLVDTAAPTLAPIAPLVANIGESVNVSTTISTDAPNGLSATINWGNGTTTAGTISNVGGVLTVSGSNVYAAAGAFNIQVTVHNAVGLGPTIGTTVSVFRHGNLTVKSGATATITSSDATATYDFSVAYSSTGVTLTGAHGTTFNGSTTLFLSGAKGVTGTLGNGNNQVRVSGSGGAFTLNMGTGKNNVTFQSFTGGAVTASATGGLNTSALTSTLASLKITAGSTAGNLFTAQGLHVTGSTSLTLGAGANDSVQITDSHFNAFTLSAAGTGAIVQVENGSSDGVTTQFDGTVSMTLGGSAQLTFSPLTTSDQTKFNGSVTITGATAKTAFHRQNVVFAKAPTLKNVTIV